MKKVLLITVLILIMVISTSVNAFAASGTVQYRYENEHILLVPLEKIVSTVGTTVKLNASFEYTSSDTQSRTYTTEEYFMTAESINAPSVTGQLSFSMGILEVYPKGGTVKACTKTYTPSVYLPSGLLYHNEAGSRTTLNILKSGNSYGKLGYLIGGNVAMPESGQGTFNNLGTASGIITTQSDTNTVEENLEIQNNDYIVTALKEKMQRSQENYEETILKEYRGILGEANKRKIVVTDEEVVDYIKELLLIYEKADNKAMIDEICSEAGITYEELVKHEFEGYRAILTEERMFETFTEEYFDTEVSMYMMYDTTEKNEILCVWETYVSELNSRYE